MGINKVVMNGADGAVVLVDLTGDSVTPDTLAEGVTAHDASGNPIVGRMASGITGDISLGVHTDGLLYIFVNGEPVGNGVAIPDGSGSLYGNVDSGNQIVLRGYVPDGTYTVKYEMDDGSTVNIGSLVLDTSEYYSVSNSLTNCTTSNSVASVGGGSSYSATISAKSGYVLSTITVMMGGVDITSSVVSSGKITIANVTGDIVITAKAVEQISNYSVTSALTNGTNSNGATSAAKGSGYYATLIANSGFEFRSGSITVTMGGADITASAVDGETINITSVTGNVVITATATPNAIRTAINSDGTPFIGTNGEKGYKTGFRISRSGGGESAQEGTECTGFIPVPNKNAVLYIKDIEYENDDTRCVVAYDANFVKFDGNGPTMNEMFGSGGTDAGNGVRKGKNLNYFTHTCRDGIKYIRMCSTNINENSILTINEPIV